MYFLPRPDRGPILKLGAVLGLALGVRVGAIILIGYIGIAFCLWLISRYLLESKDTRQGPDFTSVLFKLAGTFLSICLIAYLVMLVWWPAAQVRPIVQPVKGFWHATHFGYSIDVFFEGSVISNKNLPWHYVSKWFLITLPEFYFIAIAVGLALGGIAIARYRQGLSIYNREQILGILILVIAAVGTPIIYTILTGPVEYDGIRHYLFVIPPLAVLAAISVAKLVERNPFSFASVVVMIAIFASMGITVIDMVQLHPHQYIFFNRLFGKGVAEAAKSFETDYWGNSYKEGVEWIVQNYKSHKNDRKIKVASCLYSLSTSYFLPEDRFEYVGTYDGDQQISDGAEPDLFLATTRWDCHKRLSGKVLHTITRKGAPLLYIIEVDHGSTKEKGVGIKFMKIKFYAKVQWVL